jgi:putative SOS response-associated peptidase YedK
MCGRYAITLPPQAARDYFGYADQPNFPPRYNIAPTQPVPIVRAERGPDGRPLRRFQLVRWGFLPSFVQDPRQFPLIINARAETAPDKPSFRAAMKRRRCLFIADAYYEWRREPARSRGKAAGRPYLFRRADGSPLALAGLYETWSSADGSEVDTACIVTTSANGATVAIHERMPAILEQDSFDLWLSPDEADAPAAWSLLRPAADDRLDFFEIGQEVNKVANDDASIQTPRPSTLL